MLLHGRPQQANSLSALQDRSLHHRLTLLSTNSSTFNASGPVASRWGRRRSEFQRALDVSTSRVLASTTRPKTEQRLDSLVMRTVGEIAGIPTPSTGLLTGIFSTPLLDQTQANFWFRAARRGHVPKCKSALKPFEESLNRKGSFDTLICDSP